MTSITNINGAVAREPPRSPPEPPAASPRRGGRTGGGKELPPPGVGTPATNSAGKLEEAVRQVNDFVQNYQRQLTFSVHKETGITVVKVIDRETDEVIRQIPPEEVLAIAEQIQAALADEGAGAGGVLVREKA